MASFTTVLNRFVGVRTLADTPATTWTQAVDTPRLRPLANEDIYFFVKPIDNSTVVRAADPLARRARSRTVATGFLAASLVIAGLVPAAYNTMAGFTLQNLTAERTRLQQEKLQLDAAEAGLLNYDRLERLSKSLKMVEPDPTDVQMLQGSTATKAAPASEPETASSESPVVASRLAPRVNFSSLTR